MSSSGSGWVDRESLMSEKDWLLKSVGMYDSGPSEMAISLGKYIRCGAAGEVRWLRMYQEFPDWQQQSGLLTNELHKDVVETPVLVFCTLIVKPRSRKALRGGTWDNKGPPTPKAESQLFDITKLYYPKDEFTVIEYVPRIQQPHVALCVLHRKGYPHVNRDLLTYACENVGRAPPENFFMSPCTDWPFNETRSYETPTMMLQSVGFNYNPENSMIGPSYYTYPMNDILYDRPTSFGYANAPSGNSVVTQDNTWTVNGKPQTATLPHLDPHAHQMSMQNDSSFTSFGNSMDSFTPDQSVTTSGNGPWQHDAFAWGEHLVTTTHDYTPDEHLACPMLWEHNSIYETNHNEILLEPSPPGEHYWSTEHSYYQDGQFNC